MEITTSHARHDDQRSIAPRTRARTLRPKLLHRWARVRIPPVPARHVRDVV